MYAKFLERRPCYIGAPKKLCDTLNDRQPIDLMPGIYKLAMKMIVNHIGHVLFDGLHPRQYGFVTRRQIMDSIANVYVAMKYAQYTKQDVLLVDVAKAFDIVRLDYIADVMATLRFGQIIQRITYTSYIRIAVLSEFLVIIFLLWNLQKLVCQGCPLYAIANKNKISYGRFGIW